MPDSNTAPWLEYLIMGVVIGGFLTFVIWRVSVDRRRSSTTNPMRGSLRSSTSTLPEAFAVNAWQM